MSGPEERRTIQRKRVNMQFKIYTSITNAGYTVDVADISTKGAFIKNRFMPQLGETINFELLDEYYRTVEAGTAKVKWLNTRSDRETWGYGIEFDNELSIAV